jgi:lantibiotic biosynthesis protein
MVGSNAAAWMTQQYNVVDRVIVRACLLDVSHFTQQAPSPLLALRAVELATPALAKALTRPAAAGDIRARSRLMRYTIRMSTRPTPFGLFAGVGIAKWGRVSSVEIGPRLGWLHARAKPTWLDLLLRRFETRHRTDDLTVVRSSLVTSYGGRTFVPQAGNDGRVSIRASNIVTDILKLASRPIQIQEMLCELIASYEVANDKIRGLVWRLIDQGFLVSSLRVDLLSPSPSRSALESVQSVANADEVREFAKEIAAVEHVCQINENLAVPPVDDVDFDCRLDLKGNTLSELVRGDVEASVRLLLRLGPGLHRVPAVSEFRRLFNERYQIGEAVPVLELLDPDIGIGYPPAPVAGSYAAGWERRRESHLRALVARAQDEQRSAISLTDEDIKAVERTDQKVAVPHSLDVFFSLGSRSRQSIDEGDYMLIISPIVGAMGAGRSFGRFAALFGREGIDFLESIREEERQQNPDEIFAELSYMPVGIPLSIASVPQTRSHVIPVGVMAPKASQVISLDDLCVRLEGDSFVLRQRTTGSRVVAGVSNMANPRSAPTIVQFLLDIQRDNAGLLTPFGWGALTALPFLPRVQCGRIVLHPARWRLLLSDVRGVAQFHHIRRKRGIPQYVHIGEGDRRLMLNLDDPAHVDELMTIVESMEGSEVALTEALPTPEDMWLSGPTGRHSCEFVASLVAGPASDVSLKNDSAKPISAVPGAVRRRVPGSEWLYARLYVPQALQDDVLIEDIAPAIDRLLVKGDVAGWFFVRYRDAASHLRLRLRIAHGRGIAATKRVVTLIDDLCERSRCIRATFDTYEREVERYGGAEQIEAVECAFCADSLASVELLRLLKDGMASDRVELASLSVDAVLGALGHSGPSRLQWLRSYAVSRMRVQKKYRDHPRKLRGHLIQPPSAIKRVFDGRHPAYAAVSASLGRRPDRVEIERSLVHMTCNRLLPAASRDEGQVLSLLERTWHGILNSRAKTQKG